MSSTHDHYEAHLAPVYSWMAGGVEPAIARGRGELVDLGLLGSDCSAGYAVDLGAGFGMHAIPLARAGWEVLAVDTSATLLQELAAHAAGLPVVTAEDDLLRFADSLAGAPDLVLCMGDTLTHLPERSAVTRLLAGVAGHLAGGGRFVLTFRDYSRALEGTDRFIPVRSDDRRILTCYLEFGDETVAVHDLLHERRADSWAMEVSAYRKLRLAPEWVREQLEACGFAVRRETGLGGMVRLVGTVLT